MRDRAVDAVDVLGDFIPDLVTATNVYREYDAQLQSGKLPPALMVGVQRMCFSHLVLACYKLTEFYKRFHDILPAEHHGNVKGLVTEFNRRGIVDFRNKVVGHIWDKGNDRPLRLSEIMQRLQTITNNNMHSFLDWINQPRGNIYPVNVVAVVETLRNALIAQHGITRDEVLGR